MKNGKKEQKFNCATMQSRDINDIINKTEGDLTLTDCLGKRFIGAGASGKTVTLNGVCGNALGAYLDGARLIVKDNAQDAVGDTMDGGEIVVYGSVGDALGYAMRGGKIFVQGNAGYRVGVHMKEYGEKRPAIVIGGNAGSFLGEYLAGGEIVVLGYPNEGKPIAGNFAGTGMHGGAIYLRTTNVPDNLPRQVLSSVASEKDKEVIKPLIEEYCAYFGGNAEDVLSDEFIKLTPDTHNPYKKMYTSN